MESICRKWKISGEAILQLGANFVFEWGPLFYNSRWIQLKKNDGTIDALYAHWIEGETSKSQGERWNVMTDLLGWGKPMQEPQAIAQETEEVLPLEHTGVDPKASG